MDETCTYAGILKKAGKGLVLDIAGLEFFLLSEDIHALVRCQAADIVNHLGEAEGMAWHSPLGFRKKKFLTTIISHHIYIVPYPGFKRVLHGEQMRMPVKEYHPR